MACFSTLRTARDPIEYVKNIIVDLNLSDSDELKVRTSTSSNAHMVIIWVILFKMCSIQLVIPA